MNWKLVFMNQFLTMLVDTFNLRPCFRSASINRRETNMAVIRDVIIPIIIVVAKPWIGPLPKMKSIRLVRNVVTLASMIEE